MATIKLYGYLNKSATKSHSFVILSPGIVYSTRSKFVSNWDMFYTKSKQILCRKRISLLTGFKVLSLASVFHRPENKTNGPLKWNLEVFGTQRWGKPTDGAQTVDEKNGIKMFKDGKNHLYFQNYGY